MLCRKPVESAGRFKLGEVSQVVLFDIIDSLISLFYVTCNPKTVFSQRTHLRIIFIACNEGKFYSYALDAIRILDLIWNIHRNAWHTDLVVVENNLDLFQFVSIYKFYKWILIPLDRCLIRLAMCGCRAGTLLPACCYILISAVTVIGDKFQKEKKNCA